jgi:hypothetical protein
MPCCSGTQPLSAEGPAPGGREQRIGRSLLPPLSSHGEGPFSASRHEGVRRAWDDKRSHHCGHANAHVRHALVHPAHVPSEADPTEENPRDRRLQTESNLESKP